MFSKNLSVSVLSICDCKNLTYEAAAALCDISPRHFASIARGQTSTSVNMLEKICTGLQRMTYNNLMAVIHKIQKKGYDFETSERLARSVFTEFLANPQGLSVEARVDSILDYEEWVREG